MELESESDNRNFQESESESDDGTSDSTALVFTKHNGCRVLLAGQIVMRIRNVFQMS